MEEEAHASALKSLFWKIIMESMTRFSDYRHTEGSNNPRTAKFGEKFRYRYKFLLVCHLNKVFLITLTDYKLSKLKLKDC